MCLLEFPHVLGLGQERAVGLCSQHPTECPQLGVGRCRAFNSGCVRVQHLGLADAGGLRRSLGARGRPGRGGGARGGPGGRREARPGGGGPLPPILLLPTEKSFATSLLTLESGIKEICELPELHKNVRMMCFCQCGARRGRGCMSSVWFSEGPLRPVSNAAGGSA